MSSRCLRCLDERMNNRKFLLYQPIWLYTQRYTLGGGLPFLLSTPKENANKRKTETKQTEQCVYKTEKEKYSHALLLLLTVYIPFFRFLYICTCISLLDILPPFFFVSFLVFYSGECNASQSKVMASVIIIIVGRYRTAGQSTRLVLFVSLFSL